MGICRGQNEVVGSGEIGERGVTRGTDWMRMTVKSRPDGS